MGDLKLSKKDENTMNNPLFHDEEIYKLFSPEYHKDEKYGLDEIDEDFFCEHKFNIDAEYTEFETTPIPEIRIDVKIVNDKLFDWHRILKYKITRQHWVKSYTEETKDDFMEKVKIAIKTDFEILKNNLTPKSFDEYVDMK